MFTLMAAIHFIICLADFLKAPKDTEKREEEKKSLIYASVILAICIMAVIALTLFFAAAAENAINFM